MPRYTHIQCAPPAAEETQIQNRLLRPAALRGGAISASAVDQVHLRGQETPIRARKG